MPSSTSKSKPKASKVAAVTRRHYIPLIKDQYAHLYKTCSVLYPQPLNNLSLQSIPQRYNRLPTFFVREGDPAMTAIGWANHPDGHVSVPFICSANDKRPGGHWETSAVGSEVRVFLLRSALFHHSQTQTNSSSSFYYGFLIVAYHIPIMSLVPVNSISYVCFVSVDCRCRLLSYFSETFLFYFTCSPLTFKRNAFAGGAPSRPRWQLPRPRPTRQTILSLSKGGFCPKM